MGHPGQCRQDLLVLLRLDAVEHAAAVDAGLLRRVADQDDGRRSHLALTPAGHEWLDAVHSARQARFGAAMAGWTPAERETFAALLTRFVSALG